MDILSDEQVQQVFFEENGQRIQSHFSENFRKTDLFLPERITESIQDEIQAFQPQILLINPPRAGLLPATWQKFREKALKDFTGPIIYSSCDAATMARDLAVFTVEGYRCETMQIFDFFPWTHHYETVSYLVKAH